MFQQNDSIISVDGIFKSFGKVPALQGVNLEVKQGTIHGLLGPNGAGKTTLVNILTTLLSPDKGTAMVAGVDVVKDPAGVRSRIGLAGQYAAVDENLTGLENLELVGRLYHLRKKEARRRAKDLLKRFSLEDAGGRTTNTYSGGMRRRLDVAASLVGEPEILFLDEPTTGLDPQSRAELWEILEDLVKEGATLLLTTQYLEEADYLADNISIVDKGQVIAEGTAEELKSRIGGGVIEIHPAKKREAASVAAVLTNLGNGSPKVDKTTGIIRVAVNEATKTLLEAVRRIDASGFELEDIELRRPTLDEVFLSLTGKGSQIYAH